MILRRVEKKNIIQKNPTYNQHQPKSQINPPPYSPHSRRYASLCVNIHPKLHDATINGLTNLPLNCAVPNPNHSPTKCSSATPNVHAARSYATGVVMLYAAYIRTTAEMNVHVPNVRAERGFEGGAPVGERPLYRSLA